MPAQSTIALASIRIAGRQYPLVSERTCKTCCSSFRETIEREAVSGRTWAAIVRDLPEDAALTARNLADHFKHQHVPVAAAAVRQLRERNAESTGRLVQEAVEPVTDYLDFARAVIGEVNQRVARGEIRPEVRDALRAAELLARYEPLDEVDEGAYLTAFIIYHELAQELMTEEQFLEFGRRLCADPVLDELARRRDGRVVGR